MKLLINTKPILNQKTGIGYCIQNIIEQLQLRDDIELFLSHDLGGASSALLTKKISSVLKSLLGPLYPRSTAASVYNFLVNRYAILPGEKEHFRATYDIYHEMSHCVLPGVFEQASIRFFVADIHDLSPLIYPEYHLRAYVDSVRKTIDELLRADLFVVKTNYIKSEVSDYFSLPDSKIRVIPNAPSYPYRFLGEEDYQLREKLCSIMPKFPSCPFVLYTGTVEPRKNLDTLIRAFSKFKYKKDYMLIIAGGFGWKYDETLKLPSLLGIEDRVKFLGYQSCEVFELLYNLADLFVYPSYYEGFGMPNIEAMQCGVPVITSSASCIPEVVGDSALLFDPMQVNELVDQMNRVIDSPELQKALRSKGFAHCTKFSWESIGGQLYNLYSEITG